MARMAVALRYDVVLPGGIDVSMIRSGLRGQVGQRSEDGQEYMLEATVTDADQRVSVRLEYVAALEETVPASAWRLENVADTLEKVVERDFNRWRYVSSLSDLAALGNAVERERPQATVRVPLLAADHDVVINDEAARRAVTTSVREVYAFWSDQEERLRAVQVRLDTDALIITSPFTGAAVDSGRAYLTAARRKASPSLPPAPVWAWASAAIALVSFALSWAPLTTATVAIFAGLAAGVAGEAVVLAPRLLARRSVTAWGMAPILALVLFACAYGAISLLSSDAITINGSPLHHLREPLLLSLSLLTTVGVLDLHVHQWVRSVAYLEMLLVAGLAGGAAVVAVRRISGRVGRIVDDLQRDREVRGR